MQNIRHLLTSPAPGTTRELHSLHFGSADSGRKAVIQSALHADEPPGLLVGFHLRRELAKLEQQGLLRAEVVLIPVANPIGMAQRLLGRTLGRFDLASGENFNRNYADLGASAFQKLLPQITAGSEPSVADVRVALRAACAELGAESELKSLRKILLGLAINADLLVDLHCDNDALLHLYTATPLWPQVEPLARLLGAELSLLSSDSGGAPFDESCTMVWAKLNELWCTRTGKPAIWHLPCVGLTLELRGEVEVSHALASHDAQAILAYLTQQGFIDGAPVVLPDLLREPRPLEGCMPIHTPRGGVLVHALPLGSFVRAGECLAEVIDPLSGEVCELSSPVEGLLFARETARTVQAGVSVAKVSGSEATRTGNLLSA